MSSQQRLNFGCMVGTALAISLTILCVLYWTYKLGFCGRIQDPCHWIWLKTVGLASFGDVRATVPSALTQPLQTEERNSSSSASSSEPKEASVIRIPTPPRGSADAYRSPGFDVDSSTSYDPSSAQSLVMSPSRFGKPWATPRTSGVDAIPDSSPDSCDNVQQIFPQGNLSPQTHSDSNDVDEAIIRNFYAPSSARPSPFDATRKVAQRDTPLELGDPWSR